MKKASGFVKHIGDIKTVPGFVKYIGDTKTVSNFIKYIRIYFFSCQQIFETYRDIKTVSSFFNHTIGYRGSKSHPYKNCFSLCETDGDVAEGDIYKCKIRYQNLTLNMLGYYWHYWIWTFIFHLLNLRHLGLRSLRPLLLIINLWFKLITRFLCAIFSLNKTKTDRKENWNVSVIIILPLLR